MAFDAGAIVATLELRKDQWDKSIRKVKDDQKSLRGLVLRNSQQFKQMGRTMIVAGGAVVGAVGVMVKSFASFDKSMTESLAIMGDISEEMRQEMAEAALEMSTKTTFAAKDLATAYFFLASAGMDAVQSIKALPVVAKFAQAGAFDLAVATDLLTDAQTAMGLSSKDAVENQKNLIKVSDILVKANTLANASVLQFSESLTNRAAAALVNVNKEMEEGVAVLAAFADKGVKGQKAGMRLAMMLNALDVSARKNKKAWEEHGLALFDAQGEMRGIGDIIADLESALGDMTTEQRAATLAQLGFNIRTKASILTLMGSSEKIKQWEKDLKSAGGTTEEVAEKQLLTLNNQFILLKNTVTKAAISVGESLAPAIQNLIVDLKSTVEKVSEWIKEHPKLTEFIAKSAIAVGGLLLVLGPLMMMLPGLVIILPLLAAGFTMLLGPIGAVAIAATAVGIAVNKLLDNYKTKQDEEMDMMIEASKGAAQFHAFRRKLIEDEIVTVEEWGNIYKKHGKNYKRVMIAISTLPEYEHIRARWEELKKVQDEAGESGKGLAGILKDELAVALGLVGEEQKTWLDYLKELGLMTLQEKQDRVNELTGYLEKIHQAYIDGKLAIDDYRRAVKLTNDEILALSTTITDTALPASRDMTGVLKQAQSTLESYGFTHNVVGEAAKKRAIDEMSMFEKIGTASMIALGQSKMGAIAQAIMSTYAGAATTLKMLGMPFAIPFIAMAIAAGFKQVRAIQAQDIPSAAEGGWIPRPALIEAGHGPGGEVIVPLDRAPIGGMGATVHFNFYAPIISTTGLSDRDMDEVTEYLFSKMDMEARTRGYSLNGT